MSRSDTCRTVDIEFPGIANDQLGPLIDLLTDLLVNERIMEIQRREEG